MPDDRGAGVRRILLARTDRIGDLVLSTPAIATVRASFPQAHITMVTSPYNRVVMERNTDVDEVVDFPRDANAGSFGARYRGYDLAVALAPRVKELQLVGATRARVRIGYTYVRRWVARLTGRLYVNRMMVSPADPELCERDPALSVPHEVDQLLSLVSLGGATARIERLRIDLTAADRALVAYFPKEPLVFHLGTRWFSQGSTLRSTLSLVHELQKFGVAIVVSCADECIAYAGDFQREGFAVASGLAFHAWAALFQRARCIVTVDTGATHVASAMRRPTLVAFEHRYFRLNSQEWAPYRVPSVLVRKPASDDEPALARFRKAIVDGVAQLIDA